MTDERLGDDLWRALRSLPRGGGIVFRHHATDARERRRLFRRLRRMARARGQMLLRAGDTALPGEDGRHGGHGPGIVAWPAHDRREAVRGVRAGAIVLFVSPVFPTRSHPGAPSLGARLAARIVRGLPAVPIALGGMDARRFRTLHAMHGWAAIDAWRPRGRGQKRNLVPT